MKVLIVEDNKKLAEYIKIFLEKNNCLTDIVENGANAVSRALNHSYDVLVLDIMLPEKNGIEICKELREKKYFKPIIMATAMGETSDKIRGLDSGADDYIVKPFELEELLARLKALTRRPEEIKSDKIIFRNLEIDKNSRIVKKSGLEIILTAKEFELLEYLIENKNQVLSREQILDHCWDFAFESFSNIVDAHIKQLRRKIDDKKNKYITTVRGIGYKIQE